MILLRALLGLVFFCALSWLLSTHRKRFPWRVVAFGLTLQFLLAGVLLGTTAQAGSPEAISLGGIEWNPAALAELRDELAELLETSHPLAH